MFFVIRIGTRFEYYYPPCSYCEKNVVNAIEYDAETGVYYLQSRYYDPEIGRFINVDGYMSTGQGILGYNMFAYCNSNPVMHVDYTGRRLMSALDRECAMMAGAFVISIPLIQIIADASVELAQDVGEAVSTAIETVNSKVEEKKSRTYSVYFLTDDSETIQYVGRVTDIGYDARMRHHEQTRGLEPAYRISGLSYAEARGIEEIGMIECHTLNALNPVNNQIHGISWKNSNGAIYMKAACNYLFNHAEDWVINIFQ